MNKNDRTGATEMFTNFFDQRMNETLQTKKKKNNKKKTAHPQNVKLPQQFSATRLVHSSITKTFQCNLLSWSLAMYGFGKNVTVLHEILENNQTFCIHVTFFGDI